MGMGVGNKGSNKGKKYKKAQDNVGLRFLSSNYGWFEVLSYERDRFFTIKFDDTGYIKSEVSLSAIRKGYVRDDSLPMNTVSRNKYPIGYIFYTDNGDEATVVEVIDFENIRVMWKSTGLTSVHESRIFKKKKVKSRARISDWNYLNVDESPSNHYVYFVYNMKSLDVVYIGRGKLDRYLHATSGTSSSYELNKLHFYGDDIVVRIFKQYMSYSQSLALEKELILLHRPYCNKQLLRK